MRANEINKIVNGIFTHEIIHYQSQHTAIVVVGGWQSHIWSGLVVCFCTLNEENK